MCPMTVTAENQMPQITDVQQLKEVAFGYLISSEYVAVKRPEGDGQH